MEQGDSNIDEFRKTNQKDWILKIKSKKKEGKKNKKKKRKPKM